MYAIYSLFLHIESSLIVPGMLIFKRFRRIFYDNALIKISNHFMCIINYRTTEDKERLWMNHLKLKREFCLVKNDLKLFSYFLGAGEAARKGEESFCASLVG